MKLSQIITIFTFLTIQVTAVYPPVEVDNSLGDDLVTIQGSKNNDKVGIVEAVGKVSDASKETKAESKKLDKFMKDQEKAKSKELLGSTSGNSIDEKSTNNAFFLSTSMIVVSEIGDKTFLVAALMAMKHPRMVVFTSAFSALLVMTILSGIVGHALPALLPQRLTQFLAAILFVVFGYNLLKEGLAMSKDAGVGEEMAEVEEEIAASEINSSSSNLENAGSSSSSSSSYSSSFSSKNFKQITSEFLKKTSTIASYVLSPTWVQVFVMTFLGEWGDRSQIATIAMAAGSDYWLVILGGIVGHGLCTGMAVIGGQLLATKISMRNVTLGGSAAFFLFSIMYFYAAYYDVQS